MTTSMYSAHNTTPGLPIINGSFFPGTAHWVKWPGITACGVTMTSAHRAQVGRGLPTCPTCAANVKTEIPGTRYQVTVAPACRKACPTDPTGYSSYDVARTVANRINSRTLVLMKKFGVKPQATIAVRLP